MAARLEVRRHASPAGKQPCVFRRPCHAKVHSCPFGGLQDLGAEREKARYSQYRPEQVIPGPDHPDHIVESASLHAVKAPRITYKLDNLRVRRRALLPRRVNGARSCAGP